MPSAISILSTIRDSHVIEGVNQSRASANKFTLREYPPPTLQNNWEVNFLLSITHPNVSWKLCRIRYSGANFADIECKNYWKQLLLAAASSN
ncbi:hypothetical protein CEXT_588361 [Caerostris extrusa]|uniref:Uncharacterized protein n=1 Tax=Caerostris extrusa TaxID=172846 RepID=A0AAV4P581_CAEEX|nr:hypothetical protein CEXT_588361 [Caerostris extrusa]